jgi:hypothetical protein
LQNFTHRVSRREAHLCRMEVRFKSRQWRAQVWMRGRSSTNDRSGEGCDTQAR